MDDEKLTIIDILKLSVVIIIGLLILSPVIAWVVWLFCNPEQCLGWTLGIAFLGFFVFCFVAFCDWGSSR
jgi:Sec-independent protein secretion pathway component TatC